jgi:hypothetical protein
MGSRVTTPIKLPPGVVKKRGGLESIGRYIDTEKVRFADGRPEKIGGWIKWTTEAFKGIARAALSWNDHSSRTITALGTTKKLYALNVDRGLIDITPQEQTVVLQNAFTTTNGSSRVIVTHINHNKQIGQTVIVSGWDVGGVHIEGRYEIVSVRDTNTYWIEVGQIATSTVNDSGAPTVTYEIPPGPSDPAAGFGFGVGGFGELTYNTARPTAAGGKAPFEPFYWSLSNFGKLLLAAPYQGPLYQWDPTINPVPAATPVAGAPGKMRGVFVTPERFVISYGASPDTGPNMDPMLLRWASQATLNDWTPSPTNTANSRRLTSGKKIMGGGVLGQGVSMIWTDTACYTHQYTGSRFVFETRLAGTAAGLAGPNAFCFAQGRAFWFGSSAFHTFGGGIQRLPNQNDVLEWLLDQLRPYYEPKCVCFYNQRFNEVWWLFTCGEASENNVYVIYNLTDSSWAHGTLERSAAYTEDGGETRPILAGLDGYLYLHESGDDADGAPLNAHVESGSFQIQEGNVLTQVLGFVPDFSDQIGEVTIVVTAKDRANGRVIDRNIANVPEQYGMIDLRTRGRVLSFKIQQHALGGTFAVGDPAIEIMAGGNKR